MIAPSNSLVEHVAQDADREVGLLEDQRRRLDLLGAALHDLVQLVQVVEVALEVRLAGALGGGADDHAALALVDASGAACAGGRARRRRAAGWRRRRRRAACRRGSGPAIESCIESRAPFVFSGSLTTWTRTSWLRLDQLVDPPALAAAAARAPSGRPGGRSRRRAGSRCAPGRCRRTPPPCPGGRCRPRPCRCCRRSSAGRGARRRARRPSSRPCRSARLLVRRLASVSAPPVRRPPPRPAPLLFEHRDAGLAGVD